MRKFFLVIPAMLATILTPSITLGAPVEFMCFGQVATIVGTNRGDDLTGTAGNDVIVGLRGNDRIDGLEGDDLICGNANPGDGWSGADDEGSEYTDRVEYLLGGPGNDRVSGGWGVDLINGGEGDDLVRGGHGDEFSDEVNYVDGSLKGGPGNDVVRGGPGDDELEGGYERLIVDGGDFLYGGKGNDLLADNATAWCGGYGCHWSDQANDSLLGGPGTDYLGTTGGDDYQYGGYGADSLGETWGDPSQNYEDFRTQDSGDDTYDGGPGSDRISFGWSSTSVFVDLAAGRATGESSGDDVLLNLEAVEGSRHG